MERKKKRKKGGGGGGGGGKKKKGKNKQAVQLPVLLFVVQFLQSLFSSFFEGGERGQK